MLNIPQLDKNRIPLPLTEMIESQDSMPARRITSCYSVNSPSEVIEIDNRILLMEVDSVRK